MSTETNLNSAEILHAKKKLITLKRNFGQLQLVDLVFGKCVFRLLYVMTTDITNIIWRLQTLQPDTTKFKLTFSEKINYFRAYLKF